MEQQDTNKALPSEAAAYIALLDVEYLTGCLLTEDLQNRVCQDTYRKWRAAVQRANMALILDNPFHAD